VAHSYILILLQKFKWGDDQFEHVCVLSQLDAVKMYIDEANDLTAGEMTYFDCSVCSRLSCRCDLQDLRERLRKKEFKKRALGTIPVEVGNGIKW